MNLICVKIRFQATCYLKTETTETVHPDDRELPGPAGGAWGRVRPARGQHLTTGLGLRRGAGKGHTSVLSRGAGSARGWTPAACDRPHALACSGLVACPGDAGALCTPVRRRSACGGTLASAGPRASGGETGLRLLASPLRSRRAPRADLRAVSAESHGNRGFTLLLKR